VERLDSFFSLEEVYIDSSSTVQKLASLEVRNIGSVQTGVRPLNYRLVLQATALGRVGMDTQNSLPWRVFLGQQVFRDTDMSVVLIDTNVSGNTTAFWAGGYVWGPRSASAKNGGIQRPAQGQFAL